MSLDPDLLDYRRNIRETNAWLAFIEVLADDDGPSVLEAAKAILVSREEPTSEKIRQHLGALQSVVGRPEGLAAPSVGRNSMCR